MHYAFLFVTVCVDDSDDLHTAQCFPIRNLSSILRSLDNEAIWDPGLMAVLCPSVPIGTENLVSYLE